MKELNQKITRLECLRSVLNHIQGLMDWERDEAGAPYSDDAAERIEAYESIIAHLLKLV